jgi:hypothetical protein
MGHTESLRGCSTWVSQQIPMASLETLCESSRVDRLLVCGGGAWVSCNHSPNSLFLSLRPILKDLTTIGVKFYIHI